MLSALPGVDGTRDVRRTSKQDREVRRGKRTQRLVPTIPNIYPANAFYRIRAYSSTVVTTTGRFDRRDFDTRLTEDRKQHGAPKVMSDCALQSRLLAFAEWKIRDRFGDVTSSWQTYTRNTNSDHYSKSFALLNNHCTG